MSCVCVSVWLNRSFYDEFVNTKLLKLISVRDMNLLISRWNKYKITREKKNLEETWNEWDRK